MARSRSAQVSSADSEFADIIGWYEDLLEHTYPPTGLEWEPVKVGPTWQYDNGWELPEHTLGWRILAWCGVWLRDKHGKPWQFTPEQTRFILWYFAVDESGDFVYHSAVLQRLKGWGKDPIAACISVAAMFAEVTFDHWDGDVPVGREEPNAWVQLVAVSQQQTQNTMKLFPSLISLEARRHYGIQVGKLNVWGLGDTRQIQAVTNNPLAIEGGRPTLIVRNETQNWNSSNGGHEMAGAIEGNAAKSEGGAARMLDICNAYRPDEKSVGQQVREAFDMTLGDPDAEDDADKPMVREFGLMYDSLEAPPNAPLVVEAIPSVIEAIRGDAVWLTVKRIQASILHPGNSQSESRRKWYNQITATEDAWVDPLKVRLCSREDFIADGEPVVLFGDGSKSDDATGFVACRMSDGLVQVLHVQQPKKGEIVNRDKVDLAVMDAMVKFKVLAFWFDPSHAKDDDAEGDSRFWWPLCDEWTQRYGKKLKLWPTRAGDSKHAVAFDMLLPSSQAKFVPAAEQTASDIDALEFTFKKSDALLTHLINARERPGKFGYSLGKDGRESKKKVDLAVCAVGARMLWRLAKLNHLSTGSGKGRVIGWD